jgi:hypothetical protein
VTKKSLSVRSSFDADTKFEVADSVVPLAKIEAWLSDPKNRNAMRQAMDIAALAFFFDEFPEAPRRSY